MKTFHKPIPILSIFALLLLFVWACRKEKPEFDLSDKDPCGCASEVSADFDIFETVFIYHLQEFWRIPSDTVITGSIGFQAKDLTADEYTWYIGNQTFNTPSTSRFFGDQWKGYDIPITLVVRKTPNNVCYPDDDGYDSITKVFHIADIPINVGEEIISGDLGEIFYQDVHLGSIEGTYRLKSDHLSDSIEITIDAVIRNWDEDIQLDFYNIDGNGMNCNEKGRHINTRTYRFIYFGFDGGTSFFYPCMNWGGFIRNPLNGGAEISLRHKYYADGTVGSLTETWYHYKGRKLN